MKSEKGRENRAINSQINNLGTEYFYQHPIEHALFNINKNGMFSNTCKGTNKAILHNISSL